MFFVIAQCRYIGSSISRNKQIVYCIIRPMLHCIVLLYREMYCSVSGCSISCLIAVELFFSVLNGLVGLRRRLTQWVLCTFAAVNRHEETCLSQIFSWIFKTTWNYAYYARDSRDFERLQSEKPIGSATDFTDAGVAINNPVPNNGKNANDLGLAVGAKLSDTLSKIPRCATAVNYKLSQYITFNYNRQP